MGAANREADLSTSTSIDVNEGEMKDDMKTREPCHSRDTRLGSIGPKREESWRTGEHPPWSLTLEKKLLGVGPLTRNGAGSDPIPQ